MIYAFKKIYLYLLGAGLFLTAPLGAQSNTASDSTSRSLEGLTIEAAKQKLLGNTQKAASIYEQILSKHTTHALAAYELARIALKANDLEKALKYAHTAAVAEPQNTWYARLLSDVYLAMGRYTDAAKVYEGLTQLFPQERAFYDQWAVLLQKGNQLPAALKAYDAIETRFGLQQQVATSRATLFLALGDTKKAARELERLREAFPENLTILHLLGEFYTQQNALPQAESVYTHILELDKHDTRATAALAGRTAQRSEDLSGLTNLVQNRSVEADLKVLKIKPLISELDYKTNPDRAEKILQLVRELEQIHPESPAVSALYAEVLLLNLKPDEATQKFQRSIRLDETNYEVWEKLLALYAQSGSCLDLNGQTSNALDIFPNKAKLYYFQALSTYWQGSIQSAPRDLQQALRMVGSDSDLRLQILSLQGILFGLQNNQAEAVRTFDEAMQLNKTHPLLQARQAMYLVATNQSIEQAAALAQQAYSSMPGSIETAHALALVRYKQNKFAESRQLLQDILVYKHPPLLELLGDIQFKTGQVEDAVRYWMLAKEKGGKHTRLLQKITDKQLYE